MLSEIEEETKDKMMQKGAGKDLCTKQNERRQRLGKRRQMSSPKEWPWWLKGSNRETVVRMKGYSVSLNIHRAEELIHIKPIEDKVLQLVWCGSLERGGS
ncbi:hypothetical protein TNCV_2553151 [Trichonephila clavipes]|nr:hypothetical protein TNCV_2553151 [Trichonephila clavipes]